MNEIRPAERVMIGAKLSKVVFVYVGNTLACRHRASQRRQDPPPPCCSPAIRNFQSQNVLKLKLANKKKIQRKAEEAIAIGHCKNTSFDTDICAQILEFSQRPNL
jgi:hypothetical protein